MLKEKSLFEYAGISLELSPKILKAVDTLSAAPSEDRGAIFTKRSVVDFMLDLVGWSDSTDLFGKSILEPSFGDGDFLVPIVERLFGSVERSKRSVRESMDWLLQSIRAVELHKDSFESTRTTLSKKLAELDVPRAASSKLLNSWLICNDFLLTDFETDFDFVVGNPPYLRQEKIPAVLLAEYKRRYSSIYDRADLYVPFIEHSLNLLSGSGRQCLICADRWMKNRYGGPLRRFVSKDFHLSAYINMTGVDAFHEDVTAYPAITLISRLKTGATRIAAATSLDEKALKRLCKQLTAKKVSEYQGVNELESVVDSTNPWILNAAPSSGIIHRLESKFTALEQAGCKVGIGVATGADRVFIAPFESLDVERTRKLPLATTQDICDGAICWSGLGVLNPFNEDGSIVDLDDYPKFRDYINERRCVIEARHVAKKNPSRWFRTIDRIYPSLVKTPKLLIPDIRGEAAIVYDDGKLYPHHNLYYITSDQWDLQALQVVLRSGIASLFVSNYTTKMRGGYFRFQAQYLRKIRIPLWDTVKPSIRKLLIQCSTATKIDWEKENSITCELYGISAQERKHLNWTNGVSHNAD